MSIVSLTQSNNNTQDNIFYNINQVPLYKPRKCILKTTNGALYLAQNMQNKEECIIKQLKPTNDGISHVLLKEITLLDSINHEHVIKMKEIFLTPEHNTCIVYQMNYNTAISKFYGFPHILSFRHYLFWSLILY